LEQSILCTPFRAAFSRAIFALKTALHLCHLLPDDSGFFLAHALKIWNDEDDRLRAFEKTICGAGWPKILNSRNRAMGFRVNLIRPTDLELPGSWRGNRAATILWPPTIPQRRRR
jgi:hypothetical protein